jgi:hypothetical protein
MPNSVPTVGQTRSDTGGSQIAEKWVLQIFIFINKSCASTYQKNFSIKVKVFVVFVNLKSTFTYFIWHFSSEDNITMLFDMCRREDGKACVKSFFEVKFLFILKSRFLNLSFYLFTKYNFLCWMDIFKGKVCFTVLSFFQSRVLHVILLFFLRFVVLMLLCHFFG